MKWIEITVLHSASDALARLGAKSLFSINDNYQAAVGLPEFYPMFSGMLIIIVVLFLPTGLVYLRFKSPFKK